MAKKKSGNKVLSVISGIVCVFLTLILISNLIIIVKGALYPERPPSAFGFTSMIVLSGSMSGDAPDHIEVGDLIITKAVDTKTLKTGDVITYMENGKTTVTHRIIGINEDGTFRTKGDANISEDRLPVKHEEIIGKYIYRIPKLGDIAMFAQTPFGMMIFIGVPILIYLALDIAVRSRQSKKKKKADDKNKAETDKLKEELERLRAQLGESAANNEAPAEEKKSEEKETK